MLHAALGKLVPWRQYVETQQRGITGCSVPGVVPEFFDLLCIEVDVSRPSWPGRGGLLKICEASSLSRAVRLSDGTRFAGRCDMKTFPI